LANVKRRPKTTETFNDQQPKYGTADCSFAFFERKHMPLTCVTMTGADDMTSPDRLVEIWEVYPFVEWGILVGSSSGPRFPSVEWIKRLVEARERTGNLMRLSLHVCGRFLREIASGKSSLDEFLGPQMAAFQRVQLNWHGERQASQVGENILGAFCRLDGFGWDPQLIFQFDGVNDRLYEAAGRRFAVAGLFDRSHGAGVLPGEWPQASTEIPCGWAGGLGPDNLAEEIPRISDKSFAAMQFWIDMETKVRTDDDTEFDLARVSTCLEIAEPFTAGVLTGT
jgi:hypothetical protein